LRADSIFMAKRSAFINSIAARTVQSRVTGGRSARKGPLIFQRDTAFQSKLRLIMRKRSKQQVERLSSFRTVVNVANATFGAAPPHGMASKTAAPGASGRAYCNISYDPQSGHGCYLLRMAPGASSAPHEHVGYEEFFMLDGELTDNDGTVYRRGDFVSLKPGSKHVSHTASGCTLAVFIRGGFRTLDEGEPVHG